MHILNKWSRCLVAVICSLGFYTVGCSFQNNTSGHPIDDNKFTQIVDGETTSDQIIQLFGAPTSQSEMAGSLLYVYRYSVTKGSGLALPGMYTGDAKEQSDELTVTFDKTTGKVKAHSLQRGIGKS
jgi:outer membrane protein assembly factor BamE (lipoprotein component of BamABCDE complex)